LIAAWAEAHDFPKTAISFAQGAALVVPRNPAYAYTVGLYSRRNAEYDRAETWFRRTRVLSWRAGDQQSYALSWIGLGNVFLHRGNYEEAKAAHLRALRVARRRGFWHIKAMALHDLFTIAVDQHQITDAERFAQQAARAYSVASPQFVALAHDVATFWMNQGFYRRALFVFQAVSKLLTRTDERLVALSSLGLLMLAYGAVALEDWTRAELAARHALELSSKRGESEVAARAQALLDCIPEHRFAPDLIAPPADPAVLDAADNLARLLVRRLTARAG
jgi:tetratricopeptide (TPR) repeat protein